MKCVNGMTMRRVLTTMVVPAALVMSASTASAQWNPQQAQQYPQYPQRGYPGQQQARYGSQQQLFVWQGRVDREIRIQMNGGRASVIQIGNNERTNGRVRTFNSVPQQDGIVTVQKLEGRGKVDVVQQPDRRNGYTAIVRMRDPSSGAGTYRIAAYWQPNGNYDTNGNGRGDGRGNGRGNGHDNGRDNGQYDNGAGGYGQHRGNW